MSYRDFFGSESSAARGLGHCNKCAACCQFAPCLLAPGDAERIAERIGETMAQFRESLQFERTPEGEMLVRMKPACRFLVGSDCSIQDFKPKGGADFECWNLATWSKTYHWPLDDVIKLAAA